MSNQTILLRECEVCGTDFQPKRSDQRYCSKACRQKNYVQMRAINTALEKKQEREAQEELIITNTTQELLHEDLLSGLLYVKAEREKLSKLKQELEVWDSSLVTDRERHKMLEQEIEFLEITLKNKNQEVQEGKKREAKLELRIETLEKQGEKLATKLANFNVTNPQDQTMEWVKALVPVLPTALLFLKDQKQDGQLQKLMEKHCEQLNGILEWAEQSVKEPAKAKPEPKPKSPTGLNQ